ncbi:PLP-dependent aminotransferase family protein [Kribbella sp. NPDC050820]|uniref:aminotransferase-like domain-containing protein n=1 Tax=Kribbella sp. NPDC050820 TaxID=3155408 RepID=UPI00340600A2
MDAFDPPVVRFSPEQVARMLVGTGARSGPLHKRLSDGLAELIDRGELPPLAVLPPERSLAAALTLSRTTVVTAYQTLRQDGRVERRQGSGTRVLPSRVRAVVSSGLLIGDHAATPFLDGPLATVDFATAALPSLELVADVAAQLSPDDYRRLIRPHHGYHLRGLPALRERIARWYSEAGVPTVVDQILITSGAQHALELVARGCLQPGDGVVVEEPTYRGALEAFARTGSRLRSVHMDADGIDVAALERVVTSEPPRLVYVQPEVHNPTGAALSPERRQRLVRLASAEQFVLVEDSSLAGTVFHGPTGQPVALPLVCPQPLASNPRLITIGSMSKLFWGGLRVGWIRASPQVVSRLAQMRGVTDLGTSLFAQEIARRLFDHADDATAERRRQLPAGLQTMTGLLAEHLPDWTWQPPRGGASLWVRLPHGDATHFAQVALRYGVALLSGAVFSAKGQGDDHTRLPYALPSETLRSGVGRLAQAWRAYTERGLGDASVVSVVT